MATNIRVFTFLKDRLRFLVLGSIPGSAMEFFSGRELFSILLWTRCQCLLSLFCPDSGEAPYTLLITGKRNWRIFTKVKISQLFAVIKSRTLIWAGHVARMEEGRSVFKILTGKPTGKRPLGSARRRWEDNIRMDLEEIGINA